MDSIKIQHAREVASNYLLSNSDDILHSTTWVGIEKYKKFALQELDQLWVYHLFRGRDPDKGSDLASSIETRLRILLTEAKGSTDVFDACAEVVRTLNDRNQRLPDLLDIWWQSVQAGEIKRPRRRGPSKHSNWGRDLHIAWAIHLLDLIGIKPTRNDASKSVSGCDIVSELLIEKFKIPLGYEGVRGVWKNYSNPQSPPSEI